MQIQVQLNNIVTRATGRKNSTHMTKALMSWLGNLCQYGILRACNIYVTLAMLNGDF